MNLCSYLHIIYLCYFKVGGGVGDMLGDILGDMLGGRFGGGVISDF